MPVGLVSCQTHRFWPQPNAKPRRPMMNQSKIFYPDGTVN